MIENLKNAFKNYKPYINGWKEMKRASVVILLVFENDKWNVLFELRSKKMRTQPGEVSFPGGKIDNDELPLEAAKREVFEEIGLSDNDFEIIAPLDILVTYYDLIIHPYLGYIKDFNKININKDEVDHVFLIPLDFLLNHDPAIIYNKISVIPSIEFPFNLTIQKQKYKFRDGIYSTVFYQYNNYIVWGITAKMLKNFLDFYNIDENLKILKYSLKNNSRGV